jgi:hypothetical protein
MTSANAFLAGSFASGKGGGEARGRPEEREEGDVDGEGD